METNKEIKQPSSKLQTFSIVLPSALADELRQRVHEAAAQNVKVNGRTITMSGYLRRLVEYALAEEVKKP